MVEYKNPEPSADHLGSHTHRSTHSRRESSVAGGLSQADFRTLLQTSRPSRTSSSSSSSYEPDRHFSLSKLTSRNTYQVADSDDKRIDSNVFSNPPPPVWKSKQDHEPVSHTNSAAKEKGSSTNLFPAGYRDRARERREGLTDEADPTLDILTTLSRGPSSFSSLKMENDESKEHLQHKQGIVSTCFPPEETGRRIEQTKEQAVLVTRLGQKVDSYLKRVCKKDTLPCPTSALSKAVTPSLKFQPKQQNRSISIVYFLDRISEPNYVPTTRVNEASSLARPSQMEVNVAVSLIMEKISTVMNQLRGGVHTSQKQPNVSSSVHMDEPQHEEDIYEGIGEYEELHLEASDQLPLHPVSSEATKRTAEQILDKPSSNREDVTLSKEKETTGSTLSSKLTSLVKKVNRESQEWTEYDEYYPDSSTRMDGWGDEGSDDEEDGNRKKTAKKPHKEEQKQHQTLEKINKIVSEKYHRPDLIKSRKAGSKSGDRTKHKKL